MNGFAWFETEWLRSRRATEELGFPCVRAIKVGIGPAPFPARESYLAQTPDNLVVLARIRSGKRPAWSDAAGAAGRPYGPDDPPILPEALARALVRPEGHMSNAAAEAEKKAVGMVRRFLAAAGKDAGGGSPFSFVPTISECNAVRGNRNRSQAVASFPVCARPLARAAVGAGSPADAAILRAVDGGLPLVPAIAEYLGVSASAVRAMSAYVPTSGVSRREPGTLSDEFAVAAAVEAVAPSKRPDAGTWREFAKTYYVLTEIWSAFGPREAAAEAVAAAWEKHFDRPRRYPGTRSFDWLQDLSEAADGLGRFDGNATGRVGNRTVELPAGAWAVLAALSRHPCKVAHESGRWNSRESAAVRAAMRAFAGERLPAIAGAPFRHGGYSLVPFGTVGELLLDAESAGNCLASLVPSVFARERALFRVYGPDGTLAGHAGAEFDHVLDAPTLWDFKAPGNREFDEPVLDSVRTAMVEATCGDGALRYWAATAPVPEGDLALAAATGAASEAAERGANRETAARFLEAAVVRYGIRGGTAP